MTKTILAVFLSAVCVLGGCSASSDGTGSTDASFLNANCPVAGEAVVADGGSSDFQGHTIGFCCGKCVDKFEAMTDAEKVAALAKNGTKLP